MSILRELDWTEIRAHYRNRVNEAKNLRDLYVNKNVSGFADLALGMTTPTGNYSASEHGLGPKILESNLNAKGRIYKAATSRGVVPGDMPYLWADAIASNAFDFYHSANVG